MATALAATDLDQALLAALRAAPPEQVGDDLVLRLPDGRIFFIDGFFAPDETGDGMAPEPGAIELAREIVDLLLNPEDVETAAGGETPELVPSSGTGFQAFDGAEQPAGSDAAPTEVAEEEEIDAPRGGTAGIDRTQRQDDYGEAARASSGSGVSLNLRAIGAISLAAGGADAPTWQNSIDLRQIVRLENLEDRATDGYFPGLARLLAAGDPLDLPTFASRHHPDGTDIEHIYQDYLETRAEWLALAEGRTIWANLTPAGSNFGDRDNSLADNLPGGITPAGLFNGGDLIVGANDGWDRLYGFDGDDVLIGYNGSNHLVGGDGNDTLITAQRRGEPAIIEGGNGDDTLIIVVDNATLVQRLADLGTVSGIERLIISPQDPTNPDYLNDDFAGGRLVPGRLVLELDAASIHAWGGHLVIDGTAAIVRFADIENWERLPSDPADPGYVHYRTVFAGETVTLAVRAGADQPIADTIVGTSGDDDFFLGGWKFQRLDGGGGNDQVQGGLHGGPIGDLDLSNPAGTPFRNVENFVLADAADSVTLSASAIAAMTDARNTLWLTSPGFGMSNGTSDSLRVDSGGVGAVYLTDPGLWTALGYMSIETAQSAVVETRLGAVYGATVNGENVYLFIQVGMEQPIVGNVAGADYWFVAHAGWVSLPRADVTLDLAVVDLDNDLANQILLSVAAVDRIAGPDGILTLNGDAGLDVVNFIDMPNWHFVGLQDGYALYQGHDLDGRDATLRIDPDLVQPVLLPDPDAADLDVIDLTNGRIDQLAFDVASAVHYAGPNQKLEITGESVDRLGFEHPEDWQLTGRDGAFLIYEGDDGSAQATLRVHDDVGQPLYLPTFTDGDDTIALADLLTVAQYGRLDGKDGFDMLRLMDAGLIEPALDFMKHVEAIDLTNTVANTFVVHASTLAFNDTAGPLYVTGDAKDTVMLDMSSVLYEWEAIGSVTNAAVSDNAFTLYQVTMRFQNGDITAQVAVDETMIQPALPI